MKKVMTCRESQLQEVRREHTVFFFFWRFFLEENQRCVGGGGAFNTYSEVFLSLSDSLERKLL